MTHSFEEQVSHRAGRYGNIGGILCCGHAEVLSAVNNKFHVGELARGPKPPQFGLVSPYVKRQSRRSRDFIRPVFDQALHHGLAFDLKVFHVNVETGTSNPFLSIAIHKAISAT